MKTRTLPLAFLLLMLSLQGLAQSTQPFAKQGDKTLLLPVLHEGYRPQIGAALLGGYQAYPSLGIAGLAYGLELSLQCPVLCTRKNYIRQQLLALRFDAPGLRTTTLAINPEYRLLTGPQWELATGPVLGWTLAEAWEDRQDAFLFGASASVNVHMGAFFAGISSRYAHTATQTFTGPAVDGIATSHSHSLRNVQAHLRLGYKF